MRITAVVLALFAALSISGCSAEPTEPIVPSEPVSTQQAPARSLDEIPGTTWLGIDSDDDEMKLTFGESHDLMVAVNGVSNDSPDNRWDADGERLTIYESGAIGTYDYEGTFDTNDGTIKLSYTSDGGSSGDLVLAQLL